MEITATNTVRLRSKDGSIHVTDEVYNTLTSSCGAILSIIGSYHLIHQAWLAHKNWHVLAFFIYSFGLLNVFTSSALHHGINGSKRLDHALRQWDYFSISLMIAGTFTPFCLILVRNQLGSTVLVVVWFLALLGIALKAFYPLVPKWITTGLFILMGWLGALVAPEVYRILSWQAVALLMGGGLAFTLGAIIYSLEKPNPFPGRFGFHEIWHLFVLTGAACHFWLMYLYILPY